MNPFEKIEREQLLKKISNNVSLKALKKLAELSSNPKAVQKIENTNIKMLTAFL